MGARRMAATPDLRQPRHNKYVHIYTYMHNRIYKHLRKAPHLQQARLGGGGAGLGGFELALEAGDEGALLQELLLGDAKAALQSLLLLSCQ